MKTLTALIAVLLCACGQSKPEPQPAQLDSAIINVPELAAHVSDLSYWTDSSFRLTIDTTTLVERKNAKLGAPMSHTTVSGGYTTLGVDSTGTVAFWRDTFWLNDAALGGTLEYSTAINKTPYDSLWSTGYAITINPMTEWKRVITHPPVDTSKLTCRHPFLVMGAYSSDTAYTGYVCFDCGTRIK